MKGAIWSNDLISVKECSVNFVRGVRDFNFFPVFNADFSKPPFQTGGSSSSAATSPPTAPTQASRSVTCSYVYLAIGAAPSAGSSL